MTVLALDLATKCGFAILRADGRIESGATSFKPKAKEGEGMRWVRFRAWLVDLKQQHDFTRVTYELVIAHGPGAQAGHIYGGLVAVLQSFCEHHRIPYASHHVGTIKKAWTGKGNASKQQMIDRARELGFKPRDDNEADAIALLHLDTGRTPKMPEFPRKKPTKRKPEAPRAPTF
jgi:crossover junction endodeoxyribonuclease RuvC